MRACRVAQADMEDCEQEVWKEVIKNLPAYHFGEARHWFYRWLYTVVHSKATDLLRYKARHPTKHLPLNVESASPSREQDPAAQYEQQVRREAVQAVLAALRKRISELSYRVFFRHWFEGESIAEIAAELGVSPVKVKCRLYKAKRRFRKLSERQGFQDLLRDH
jgi:RNA polymerase sigma factor (sigma-70 family)